MIIYNVTINIDQDVAAEWVKFMKDQHIPNVMATGCFTNFLFTKVLTNQEDETGETYSVQYHCTDMRAYEDYRDNFSRAMQQEVAVLYDGKFAAFRTLLQQVD